MYDLIDRKSIIRELESTIEHPDDVAEATTTYRFTMDSRIYEIQFYVHACRSITLYYYNSTRITPEPSNECRLIVREDGNTIINILLISEDVGGERSLLQHPHKWNVWQYTILKQF